MIEEHRQLAARVAGQAEIIDIQVFKLTAELLLQPKPGEGLRYDLQQSVKYSQPSKTLLVAEGTYELEIWQQIEADERSSLATVSLVAGALYQLPDDERSYSDEELQAFAETTGQFALYPFVRQQVYDLTGRIGLPPLVLGVLRMGLDRDEVAAAHTPND